MAPRETENNAYVKFWGDKQRTLWYVMVFLELSIAPLHLVCCFPPNTGHVIIPLLQNCFLYCYKTDFSNEGNSTTFKY